MENESHTVQYYNKLINAISLKSDYSEPLMLSYRELMFAHKIHTITRVGPSYKQYSLLEL